MLDEAKLGGVLINAQHNFAWLTGGASNGIDLSRESGAASLLVTAKGRRFLLANNIEMRRLLAEELSADDFEPIEYRWQDEKREGFVIEKVRGLLDGGDLATETGIEGELARCRYRLTADEISRYRRLGREAAHALSTVVAGITPGESEIEIAEKMRHQLAVGRMISVVTLVGADERIERFRHPLPTSKRWNKTLLLVTCAKRGGLIASLSRMITVGTATDELKRRTEAAAHVNACLLDATRPGASGAELYRVAAEAYSAKGFADEIDKHHQGGAAGYQTRDWVAHPASNEIVRMDQAFAWNPSITGTKVEQTSIVTADGFETLTASAEMHHIPVTLNGREYLSPGIIQL